jgi:hypothetical protein
VAVAAAAAGASSTCPSDAKQQWLLPLLLRRRRQRQQQQQQLKQLLALRKVPANAAHVTHSDQLNRQLSKQRKEGEAVAVSVKHLLLLLPAAAGCSKPRPLQPPL